MSVRASLAASLAAVFTLTSVALAADPVALVMEVSGTTTPPLQPFTELSPHQTIVLGADSHLTLVHYPTCREISLDSGSLTVGPREVTFSEPARSHIAPGRCPTEIAAATSGPAVAGGRLVRGIGRPLEIPADGRCFLVGDKVDDFATVQLADGRGAAWTGSIENHAIRWQPHGMPLQPGESYTLELLPKSKTGGPLSVDVSVAPAPSLAPCIIRVR